MKSFLLFSLTFLIISCSSNKEKSNTKDLQAPIEKTYSIPDQQTTPLIDINSTKDSIIETSTPSETESITTDTLTKNGEVVDPRIQRILDEKLTQEMKDSLRKTNSEKK